MATMEANVNILLDKGEFEIKTLDDELRVDDLCRKLLLRFYEHLLHEQVSTGEASALASSADYFIRDFVIDKMRRNILDENPEIVRQFAGKWYIINTLEPNLRELSGHLGGILAFYRFLYRVGSVSAGYLDTIEKECNDLGFYEERITSFWDIKGDGYIAWEQASRLL
jgi:hypothetical protein